MNTPRVSICLPNLNTLPYLAERMETIQEQTFMDWELLVYDSYSNDGAWEYFTAFAEREPRMRAWQGPREGTPGSWTPCIRETRGEYIYIATSDDTMAPDCLEKMVRALDDNPDCDLAHCPIRVIDGDGKPGLDWWSGHSTFARSSGELWNRPHKRLAPLDGILCLLGDNIYTSVTQLLIRRSLFDKIGYFEKGWGAAGDFHWNLRAGLAASVVHVPDTWGGWRIHASQATDVGSLNSPKHLANIDAMIDDVLGKLEQFAGSKDQHRELESLAERARDLRVYLREHSAKATTSERGMFLIHQALSGRGVAWRHLASMAFGDKRWPLAAPESVKSWFDNAMMIPLPGNGETR